MKTRRGVSLILALIMCLALVVQVSAEETVYTEGVTVAADPTSPTGYRVTFVYKNGNATAVRLAGDLTQRDLTDAEVIRYQPEQWKAGRYHTGGTEFLRDMVNVGNGYWVASIPMHAGGLSYWYRVDDPTMEPKTNKRIWDPTASHPRPEYLGSVTTYRTVNNDVLGALYVPYNERQNDAALESRSKYELPAEVQGTVTYVPYTPSTPAEYPDLRQPDENYYLGVYLPPNYDENRAEPYPVVYLNHGVYGDETDWMIPGNAPNIIDNLIASGEIEPTVLVTMGNHFSTVPNPPAGLPENGYNPPVAAKNIVETIMPYMEANYNVSDKPEGRAVGGFSYGGATTWKVLYDYADLFSYFGFFSAFGSLDSDQLGKIKENIADETKFAMIGNGIFEGPLSDSGRDGLRSIGFNSETHQVPGAHDMMTASQLFTIFARDYLWEEQSRDGFQSASALTDMGWWGQRVTGVVLQFTDDVDVSKLTVDDFKVRDTSFNPYFDSGSFDDPSFMQDQKVVDVFTVADPALLLDDERPNAPGRYAVVMVEPNFNGGTKVSVNGGMMANPNQPTEITFVKDIFSTDGELLVGAGEESYGLNGTSINRKIDKYVHGLVEDPTAGVPLNYHYRLPANYDPAKKYPLVVYFNGYGQGYFPAANNLGGQLICDGTPQFWFGEMGVDAGEDVIFLAPQSTRPGQTSDVLAEQAAELIENFSKEFAVDTNRVYGYTLSMGSALGWWLLENRIDLFAAFVQTGMIPGTQEQADAIAAAEPAVPIWLFQGEYDHLFGSAETKAQYDRIVAAYTAKGYTSEQIDALVKITVFPDSAFEAQGPGQSTPSGPLANLIPDLPGPRIDRHAPMVPAFQDPATAQWMLSQEKP